MLKYFALIMPLLPFVLVTPMNPLFYSRVSSFIFCACAVLCFFIQNAFSAEIRGAGSTAAASLYKTWGDSFRMTGHQLIYDATGSSAGIKAVLAGDVDFGASDVPLPQERLKREGLICIPTAITGIVPALNLPGVPQGGLRFSGPLLASIMLGKVKRWNDEAIRALNPRVKLPAEIIRVVARKDGSGSTWVLSKYLSEVSPEWRQEMGNNSLLKWPENTVLAKGSSGMADVLKQTPYSIGYLEPGYIERATLDYALVANKTGRYVKPDAEAFRAALSGSRWTFEGDFEDSLINRSDRAAWPITTGTFIIMRRIARDPRHSAIVANFFSGAFMQADNLVPQAGFVPLPMKTQARAVKALGSMVEVGGIPLPFDVIWRPVTTLSSLR